MKRWSRGILIFAVSILLVSCGKVEHKKEFYPNGQVMAEKIIKGSKTETKVYHLNGNLVGEYQYKNGALHGTTKIYYNDGNIFRVIKYRNGDIKHTKQYDTQGKITLSN